MSLVIVPEIIVLALIPVKTHAVIYTVNGTSTVIDRLKFVALKKKLYVPTVSEAVAKQVIV